MPHGRPRKPRSCTRIRRRERFTAKRTPLGYTSWLRFMTENASPEGYLVQSKRGFRVQVTDPDPLPIRRVAREELVAVEMIVRSAIERIVRLAGMAEGWKDAPHLVWRNGGEGGVGLRLAARLVGAWPTISSEGVVKWIPLDRWERLHAPWAFAKEMESKEKNSTGAVRASGRVPPEPGREGDLRAQAPFQP